MLKEEKKMNRIKKAFGYKTFKNEPDGHLADQNGVVVHRDKKTTKASKDKLAREGESNKYNKTNR